MLSWEKVMGITFSRKCIQFSCFLFSSTHLRWIWFVWFRAHTLILVDLDNICYIWGSGCPPRWNNLLAVAFILFTWDICYYRVSRKTYTCAAHVQPMLFRAGGNGVCGCLCLYERRQQENENAYSRAGNFLTCISCLLLLAYISGFQSTPKTVLLAAVLCSDTGFG